MNPTFGTYVKTLYYIARNVLSGDGIYPIYASFKVTSKCGSSCVHCYVPREEPTPDLDTESAKRVIENLAGSSPLVLTFEGGEPFLRDDIGELLEYANRFPVFVSVVTSYPDVVTDGYSRTSRFIDFLQISIDEGHGNASLFDRLRMIVKKWDTRICIQTVVTAGSVGGMEKKVLTARAEKCKILFIPLSPIYPDLVGRCPDKDAFIRSVRALKKKYPGTVVCSKHFLSTYKAGRGCSSSTIVIDSDGSLFYPCHIMNRKPFNLLDGKLEDFLSSARAKAIRAEMRTCPESCAWYQYFAVSLRSIRSLPHDILSALERIR